MLHRVYAGPGGVESTGTLVWDSDGFSCLGVGGGGEEIVDDNRMTKFKVGGGPYSTSVFSWDFQCLPGSLTSIFSKQVQWLSCSQLSFQETSKEFWGSSLIILTHAELFPYGLYGVYFFHSYTGNWMMHSNLLCLILRTNILTFSEYR